MENNEELVSEETENVEEQTTEEIVKDSTESNDVEEPTEEKVEEPVKEEIRTYTDEEVNEIASKRAARVEKKLRREYEKKYSKLGNVLNAGLGTSNLEDATTKLEDFYKEKGINIPDSYEPKMSDDDIEWLANKDAEEIVSLGYDEMKEEGDRLAKLGKDMTQRERLVLEKLTSKAKDIEEMKELSAIGVTKEQVEDKDFKEFEKKLNPNLSLKEKYEMYQSTKPKKEIKQMGSMKSGPTSNDLKDYYTYEEASRLTDDDYKKNPKLYEIIEKSAQKW